MALATVSADIAPLYERPDYYAPRLDEAFCGAVLSLVQEVEGGFCYVRSAQGTEGYMPTACLVASEQAARAWRMYDKLLVLAPYMDVSTTPREDGGRLASLPRGGLLAALAAPDGAGWQKVGLPTGQVGYTRASYLGAVVENWAETGEEALRWNLTETALAYNGASWRRGGRTMLGIDDVGLVAMAYSLNGIELPRKASFTTGGLLNLVEFKHMAEGDLIYFRDTVGLYLGEGKFIHATCLPPDEGVVISSLNTRDPSFRPDLAGHITAVASLF